MEEIIYLEFGRSRSANLNKAIRLSRRLSQYREEGGRFSFCVTEIREYFVQQETINEVIDIVRGWKTTKILLFGHQYLSAIDYAEFLDKLRVKAGKYALILDSKEKISNEAVTIESLPLPFVFYPRLYGSFFAFSDDIDGMFYFCECERTALENCIRLKKNQGDGRSHNWKSLLKSDISSRILERGDVFHYQKGLCFRCNNKVPQKLYCHPMYGGQFKQHYGWYINQEFYKTGIDMHALGLVSTLPEVCSPEVYDTVQRIRELAESQTVLNEHSKQIHELRKGIERAIENSVREQLGFRKIGDAWISETMLYNIIQGIYPGEEIIRHYRPQWLEGLELDIYIPKLGLGFEYQGIQHFKAVDHWGGTRQLERQQARDKRKKELCDTLGVKLICVDYDEPLTTEYVQARIDYMRG